jgi:hypothetical protein
MVVFICTPRHFRGRVRRISFETSLSKVNKTLAEKQSTKQKDGCSSSGRALTSMEIVICSIPYTNPPPPKISIFYYIHSKSSPTTLTLIINSPLTQNVVHGILCYISRSVVWRKTLRHLWKHSGWFNGVLNKINEVNSTTQGKSILLGITLLFFSIYA